MAYISNEWEVGDYVTKDKMNNIENGISVLDTTKEALNNKTFDINEASTDDEYPSAKAVWDLMCKVPGFEPNGGGSGYTTLKSMLERTTSTIHDNVLDSIGHNAFATYTELTSVAFENCKVISSYAFADCRSLTTASFPAATIIGSYAFSGCTSLSAITLTASSVCSLSNSNAFSNTALTNIYVPASLVSAYQSASNWSYFSSMITAIEDANI